jgi:hypothetical protein
MDLGMLDRFGPSLKTRSQLEERRYDMNRSDKNSEIYIIPMHRKNCWTNKWMQDPRKNFFKSITDPKDQICSKFKVLRIASN